MLFFIYAVNCLYCLSLYICPFEICFYVFGVPYFPYICVHGPLFLRRYVFMSLPALHVFCLYAFMLFVYMLSFYGICLFFTLTRLT